MLENTTADKVLLTRRDAARLLSVSVRTIDTLLARRELTTRRIGRRRLIPRAELARFARRDHATGPDGTKQDPS